MLKNMIRINLVKRVVHRVKIRILVLESSLRHE
jgi:hypothetical protein